MTLDITIGKIYVRNCENLAYVYVHRCPDESTDICNIEYTLWTNEAYRSGSTDFRDFFEVCLDGLYTEMREYHDKATPDVAFITPFIDRINKLSCIRDNSDHAERDTFVRCDNEANVDRMKWFKFWCNKAIELYGDDAGIMWC